MLTATFAIQFNAPNKRVFKLYLQNREMKMNRQKYISMPKAGLLMALISLASPAYAGDRCDELWGAAMGGDASSITSLVNAGVNVNCTDAATNETPLMAAAGTGNADAVRALLSLNADPNQKNPTGHTALTLAQGKYDAFSANPNMAMMADRFKQIVDALQPVTTGGGAKAEIVITDADPNMIAKLKFESVNAAMMARQYGDATTYLNEILNLNGVSEANRAKALSRLGDVGFSSQNWQQAKDSCEKVMGMPEADPEDQESCKQTLKDLRTHKPELFQ